MSVNIILTGMPGAGKSTVGVILAKTIGFGFVDVDIRISGRQGMKLQELLDTKGLRAFLEAEEYETLQISCDRTVIATGGSVVMSERAMTHLGQLGINVYLDVPRGELERRLINIKTRGIASEPGATLREIYDLRTPLYKKYADIHVMCAGKSTEEIVEELAGRMDSRL